MPDQKNSIKPVVSELVRIGPIIEPKGLEILDLQSSNYPNISDMMDKWSKMGMFPVNTSSEPEIVNLGPTQHQYDLLEFATDCVLDGIITRGIYTKLRALIRTKDPENMKLAKNILDKKCEK